MISRKQYLRLTIVLLIPLMLLGGWLVVYEKILPLNNVIYCRESDSEITCNSILVTKVEANKALHQNGAVRLWDARLEGGFNHTVISLGQSEIKIVNGKATTLPPINGGVRKNLSLPPMAIRGNIFESCQINPIPSSETDWFSSCIGGDFIPEKFYFSDEKTRQKFQSAMILIEEQRKKNKAINVLGIGFTALVPLIVYFLISAALLLLSRVVRHVLYGRN